MRGRASASLVALAVVGLLLLAGCGGGGSTGGGSSFVSGAEAACTSANQQLAALGTPQQDEVAHYMERTEAVIEKLHREVEALGGSGSAETAYTEGLSEAIPVLTEMTNAARSENYEAVRELSDELVKIHLGELAEAAQLKSCAEVPEGES